MRNTFVQLSAAVLCVFILAAPATARAQISGADSLKPTAVVDIPDPHLRSFLHEKTGIPLSKPIRRMDLFELTGAFDLSGKKITETEGLQYCVNIEELDLSGNQLSRLTDISALSRLHTLNLRKNSFSEVPLSIYKLAKLQNLDLGYNQITALPDEPAKLAALKTLNLEANQFFVFPDTLTGMKLEALNISGNPIGKLPDSISDMPVLKSLTANECKLSKLPASLFNLQSVSKLYLKNNDLSTLSKSIAKLSNLEDLNLSGNQLESLPDEICMLTKLKILNVTQNKLFSLPVKIGELPAEEMLFSGNNLSTLPASIAKAGKLKKLDAHLNRITRLPESFKSLRSEYFNLDWNFMDVSEGTAERKTLDAITANEKFFLHQLTPIKNLEAVSHPDAITLRWSLCTEGSDEGAAWKVDNYSIYAVSGGETTKIAEVLPASSEYTVESLTPATPYAFKVSVEYTVEDNIAAFKGSTAHYALIDARTADNPPSAAPQVSAPVSPAPSLTIPAFSPSPSVSVSDKAEQTPEISIPAWVIIVIVCVGIIALAAIILVIYFFLRKKSE